MDDRQDQDRNGPYAHERKQLVPMSTLESWTVSDDDPDIRGWDVQTIGGRRLGSVGDLLIDDGAGEVVFLEVDLADGDQRTFVPLRVVHIDRALRVILMDSADVPEAHASRRDRPASPGRRSADSRTIRYPTRTRDRLRVVDDAAPLEVSASDDVLFDGDPSDLRRSVRRRIDRLSTGI